MMKANSFILSALLIVLAACSPKTAEVQNDPSKHVDWSRNATIYEVNIRQFTPEGTFKAFEKELPRLKRMGVDILWMMPVHPIGEKNRKGSLGSYYAVRDYLGINPEYGTRQDFTNLVNRAHELGMKVIIDWVANHTSWDNNLITEHPEWYKKDDKGNIIAPVADWTDVAALDYTQPGLRKYMTEALLYWVKEFDIDGYRCDVAGMIPVSFWREAIPEVKKIKPVFMLAEEEKPVMHDTGYFDATYSWGLFHLMNAIAQGRKPASILDSALAAEARAYNPDAFRMRFTSNHDENSWNGTEYERMDGGAQTFGVLTFTLPGIPLIYTGQESAMNKRLRFFDKDTIAWGGYSLASYYFTLTNLKKKNNLLDAGAAGGQFIKVQTSADQSVYAFMRKNEQARLFVILNLSSKEQVVTLNGSDFAGNYTEAFSKVAKSFAANEALILKPWEYLVFESN